MKMTQNMSERLKQAQKNKDAQSASHASVESTFKKAADVSKRQTKKWTFNMDADIYRSLRQEAFEKETDMTSLVNAYLRKAIR